MIKVAITGGLGSGKSTVLAILKEKGLAVIDADDIISSLYSREDVQKEVFSIFSSLDRKVIAWQAFSEPGKRKELESLLHPLARRAVGDELERLRGEKAVFVEAPLLFETGFEGDFDSIVVVKCETEKRIERLGLKGISREEAMQRMRVQLSDEERIKKADFVIDNSGPLEQTRERVEELLKKLGV